MRHTTVHSQIAVYEEQISERMAGAPVAAAAAMKALDVGMKALESISENYYENDGIMAWWNDWKSRDQRARIERT